MKATSAVNPQFVRLVQDMAAALKTEDLAARLAEEYAAEQITPGIDPTNVKIP